MATRPGTDQPTTTARVQDYWLGGKDNLAADRTAADAIHAIAPWITTGTRASRSFLRRAVIHMTEAGIEQLLDIGCGLPHDPNVHQIAQVRNPRTRVTYVDNDPMVLAHARARLATDQRTVAIHADARDPDDLLTQATKAHLDLTRPVGVLMIGLLEYLSDQDATDLTHLIRQTYPPGSHLAIAHLTADPGLVHRHIGSSRPGIDADTWQRRTHEAAEIHHAVIGPLHLRNHQQLQDDFFRGTELVRPGLTRADRWRAPGIRGPAPAPVPVLAGVARLPATTT
jgi:O-methyltransferase involved in polyketide biosynthesis